MERKFCPDCGAALVGSDEHSATIPDPGSSEPTRDSSRASLSTGPLEAGQRIADRYRIVSLLGRGGMGEVYRADDLHLGESVALKFLPAHVAQDPVALDRFRKEVRAARGVTHPNVCRIHDIGETGGRAFLSMEYVDGEDLAVALKRLGRPSPEKALEIARQLCLGLAAIHEAGIVHRDLKPANIMIDGRGNVRLMDFGIAELQEDAGGASSGLAGSPPYMAPELFEGTSASRHSDLYALGLVLYEVFTGKRAQETNDRSTTRTSTTVTAPSTVLEAIDPLAERAILQCLETNPEERPSSAYALLNLLPGGDPLAAAVAAGQTPSPEMVAAAGEPGVLRPRVARALLLWILLAIVGLVLLSRHTLQVNQLEDWDHPAVLEDKALELIKDWGYQPAKLHASGYAYNADDELVFWYRQRPEGTELLANAFYSSWGRKSRSRVRLHNPPDLVPGELQVVLDLNGTLRSFSATPLNQLRSQAPSTPVNWERWLKPDFIGTTLSDCLESKDHLPPDPPYDQIQAWRTPPGDMPARHVQAATEQGKLTSFLQLPIAALDGVEGERLEARVDQDRGRQVLLLLYTAAILGACALAWQNYRRARVDRTGAWRVAFLVFCCSMVAWLLLASHQLDPLEGPIMLIGMSQALLDAFVFWVFYLGLEPYVRSLWPRVLISWSRMVGGRWRDALVARDILAGLAVGVLFALLRHLEIAVPELLGLSARELSRVHPFHLEGVGASAGQLAGGLRSVVMIPLFLMFCLVVARLALRRTDLASILFVALMTAVVVSSNQHHPVLGWVVIGAWYLVYLWVLHRFGYLTLVAWLLCESIMGAPLTSDFTRWYASSGVLAILLVVAMAVWATRRSQGVRPSHHLPAAVAPR